MIPHRRQSYRSLVYKPDFFITSHIEAFIQQGIQTCVRPRSLVVDIGCGEQPLRSLIESAGGSYTGIDITQNDRGSVDLLASITHVPVADSSFDVIICSEVLEHVADTAAAFDEIARIIKPGGFILLTTPFAYPLHEEPFDFVRMTSNLLKYHAQRQNLEIIELRTLGNEIEVLATVIDSIWIYGHPEPQPFIYKMGKVLSRMSINSIVCQLDYMMNPILPGKYYLSLACILHKPLL